MNDVVLDASALCALLFKEKGMDRVAELLDGASCDEDELRVEVPTDGTVASLRHLLGRLDDAGVVVEHLSIHSPNLDDVFFAVTGRPTEEAFALP